MHIRYERFLHRLTPTLVTLRIAPETGAETVTISVSGDSLDQMQLNSISPTPSSFRAAAHGVEYSIAVDEAAPLVNVRYQLNTNQIGPVRGRFQCGADDSQIEQFVYP